MPDGGTLLRPRRPSALPASLAPRFLGAEAAAEYVGVCRDTFLWEVAQGWWPAGVRRGRKGGLVTWDRLALDDHADLRSGRMEASPAAGDAAAEQQRAAAEAAALEGVKRATAKGTRAKPRPPQAA